MIKGAISRPYLVLVGVLMLFVLGSISYKKLAADLLPTFNTPAVQIVTFYPGMPPEVMERDIMSRLERWTGQSVGIDHQEAKGMLGVSIVKDFFREDISLETAMSQVTSYAVSDMFYLPPGTIPPMVMPFDPTASVPLCLVTVSSETMTEKELYDVAYFELRNRLQSIRGVIAPAVYGGKLRRILAYVDPEKLAARGLSPMDVVTAIHEQSVFVPAGNMKAGDIDYQIFADAMPARVEELNDIPIAVSEGKTIFLRDVARAQDSSQIQSNIVRINGRRQVYIPIYRQPGANTIEIVDAIRDRLERIGARLREMDAKSADLVLAVNLDQSTYVRESVGGLQFAGLIGALLAGMVVLLFLRSAKSTFIVTIVIPLALLAAMVGLFATKQTLNAMTLGGLALAVGIVVDQAIVVIENIIRHLRQGKNRLHAAIDGTSEVAGPILVSTITFAVVFYPVVFLSGMASFLFTPLALAATFALSASLVLALTVVPTFCARFLDTPKGEHREGIDDSTLYGKFLARVMQARLLVVGGAIALAVFAGSLVPQLGSELFPPVDSDQFQMTMRLASGTRIEETEKAVSAVEQVVIDELGLADPEFPARENQPESNLRMLISNIGVLMDWPAAYTPNSGPMDAFLLVQLKGKSGHPGVFESVARLRARLNQEFPDIEFAFDTGGMLTAALNYGEPAPIHFQLMGSNLETLDELARRVALDLRDVPGLTDARVMQRVDYPTIEFKIDRPKARLLGITVEDIMHNLVTATNSSINFNPAFWIDPRNGNHYFIGAQYAETDHISVNTLLDIPIKTESGSTVPLRTLATVQRSSGPNYVSHYNITRVFDVYANSDGTRSVGEVVADAEEVLAADPELAMTPAGSKGGRVSFDLQGPKYKGRGYTLAATGEVQTMRDAFDQFSEGLLIALCLVYLVMVAQFRSFVDPFIILLTVPLGFIGVVAVLLLTGTSLNIQSLMGIIMVVGIVVEYGIVLVDFANHRLAEGASPIDAAREAAQVRLRPLLMTSLTTVLALLPMAFGFAGGEANAPLAKTIVGGVLGAAVLTLVVLPALYALVKRPLPARPADSTDNPEPAHA